jgi:hypothetical protein
VYSVLTSTFELLSKTSSGIVGGSVIGGREYPFRDTSPGYGRNPARFFMLAKKVIVKNRAAFRNARALAQVLSHA